MDSFLIVNEIVDYYNKSKESCFIFKIEFEKAFDTMNWEHIKRSMEFIGFGGKWISSIMACLTNAKVLILINGNPSNEFAMRNGVRQGDPLSPFLFIIAAESLSVLANKAREQGKLFGISVGSGSIKISY